MSDELKIQIPIVADNSAAGVNNFKNSIDSIVNKATSNGTKIKLDIDLNSAKQQVKQWQGIFKETIQKQTNKNVDLSQLNNYYKNLEKLSDSFYKKNISQIDAEIKAKEQSAKRFSDQLKEQMTIQSKLKNSTNNTISKYGSFNIESDYQKLNISLEGLKHKSDAVSKSFEKLNLARDNISKYSSLNKNELYQQLNGSPEKIKEYINLMDEYKVASKNLRDNISIDSKANSNAKALNNEKLALERATIRLQEFDRANDKFRSNKDFSNKFDNLMTKALSGNVDDVSKFTHEINSLEIAINNAGLRGESFGKKLSNSFSKLGLWFSATSIMLGALSQIKQMTSNVIELDTAMTELKKVTDETDNTYNEFLEGAATRAKTLGATISDVVTATADFARLGYDISDASEIADAAILYKNVGDGITDISQASSSIISTMKAFGIEADNVVSIVDKFNISGNNFSISSGGLGDALLRSASALAASGNTLEESIGMIIAMNETVQDVDVVGTAMKTISMRLRNTSGQLEELNEDAEGAAESITQLQTQLLNLTNEKVNIMLDSNTFKSTFDIVTELSQVWNTLSDKSQADVTRLVAGIRQGNTFTSLMENMSTGAKATATALNASGSAMAENEKYLESIAGKIERFNAKYQSLSTTVIDGDFIKSLVDGGASLLDVLDKIISKIGLIPIAISSVAAIKNKGKTEMKVFSKYALYNLVVTRNEFYKKMVCKTRDC